MGAVDHPFQEFLEHLYAKYKMLKDGHVATYIPELAKMSPDWFSICVATVVGHDIFIDVSVFTSERATGYRNRAMAYLMRHFNMIDEHIDNALDLYF
jgi:glutaminase